MHSAHSDPTAYPIGAATTLDQLARDPYPVYAQMQADEPISWVPVLGMYYVVRYDDVLAILRDSTRFTVGTEHSTLFDTFNRHMLTVEGELHDRYRMAYQPHFLPAALRVEAEKHIRAHVDRLLESFVLAKHAEVREAFAARLPIMTMLSLLGLPLTFETEIRHWYDSFESALANFAWDAEIRETAHRNVRKLRALIQQGIDHFRGTPDPTKLLSQLVSAPESVRLTDEEIQRNCLIVLFGGISTVEALILNALFALLAHPDTFDRVRRDHSLLTAVLEETMRWSGPVQSATRHVSVNNRFRDIEFKRGDVVNCMIAAANRDSEKFPDPHRFDIDRSGLRHHLGFALGSHHCLGLHLARLEARVALESLLTRFPNIRADSLETSAPYGNEFRKPSGLLLMWD